MDIKSKSRMFSLIFSVVMILMLLALSKSLEVQAAGTKPHLSQGRIYIKTGDAQGSAGFVYFQASNDKVNGARAKGLSYNKKTNTLTIDRFNKPGWWIICRDMGDLKVVTKGTSKFGGIQQKNSLIWTNTLSITGNGKLVLKGKGYNLECEGTDARITIGKDVKIDARNTGSAKTALVVIRNGKVSGSKVFNIKGSYSSGKVKRYSIGYAHLGSCYRYQWSKSTFKKTGKGSSSGGSSSGGSSSSSTSKPAKMSFSASGNTTPKYDHGIYVQWNKVTKNAVGYQLQISSDSSFSKLLVDRELGTNYVRFDYGYSSGYTLYARIRAYNKVNGTRKNGDWSAVKSFMVK